MRVRTVLVAIIIWAAWGSAVRAQQPVVAKWDVFEQAFQASGEYANPFTDVRAEAVFSSPTGVEERVDLFYDGDGVWVARFAPPEVGRWSYRVEATDAGLRDTGRFTVVGPDPDAHGFVQATPDRYWGFAFEDGTPVFLLGDTMYNLFGAAASGQDYRKMLLGRKAKGYNLFRARLQVSQFHPPRALNVWQERDLWPWGGTREDPDFFQPSDGCPSVRAWPRAARIRGRRSTVVRSECLRWYCCRRRHSRP